MIQVYECSNCLDHQAQGPNDPALTECATCKARPVWRYVGPLTIDGKPIGAP